MEIEKRKTCYNCKHYDSENDWCEKHHEECEVWRHIGQEYTCCELASSKGKNALSKDEEQHLLDDGTLVLYTEFDLTDVSRINVCQIGTHYGDLFYRDEE